MYNDKDPQWESMVPEPGIYDISEGSPAIVNYSRKEPLFVFITAKVREQFKCGNSTVKITFATPTKSSQDRAFSLGLTGTLFHIIIEERFNSKRVAPIQFFTHSSLRIRKLAKGFKNA